jgi:hypothetical protein
MTIAEILLQDFDTEMKGARTTLERIPETNPEFKCHDKSMPMGRLAVHVSTLPRFGINILTTDARLHAPPIRHQHPHHRRT